MGLFGKSTEAIVDQAISDLRQNTAITRYTPGAKARALVKVLGQVAGGLYDTFDFNQIIPFVSGASGIYLDFIGELVNIPRLPATQSRVDSSDGNLMFYTLSPNFGAINGGQSIRLPANTIVSTPDLSGTVVRYRTVGEHVLPSNVDQYFVSVEAVVEGSASNVGANSLVVHSFSGYEDSANESLLVTNLSAIDTGSRQEGDDLYRYRLINSAFRAENANRTAVRLACLAVPSIADVVIIEFRRGIGTGDVIIESQTGYVTPEQIAAAQAAVDEVRAHSAHILVQGPEEIGMTFEITLRYRAGTADSAKALIELDVGKNLRRYIRELAVGESFVVNEAVQRVMETDDRILDMGIPGQPFDGIYTYHAGVVPTNRIRRRLLANYIADIDEKLVVEQSQTAPILIRRA